MKNTFIITIILVLLGFSVFLTCCFTKAPSMKNTQEMIFTISTKDKKEFKINNMFINLKFENTSNKKIKLLNYFEPIPVLHIEITSENGKYISLGGGKADFSSEQLSKYIEIPKKKSYTKLINMSEEIERQKLTLPSGIYKLKISYRNQYGKGCIKGIFYSNELQFNIVE